LLWRPEAFASAGVVPGHAPPRWTRALPDDEPDRHGALAADRDRLPEARDVALGKGAQLVQRTQRDGRRRPARYGIVVRQPHGGRRSPLFPLADWREALVVVAAHEAWHIHQFRTGLRYVEAEGERFAAEVPSDVEMLRGRTLA